MISFQGKPCKQDKFRFSLFCITNISAELAGAEKRLDSGAKANNVQHGAGRETLQRQQHGFLQKQQGISHKQNACIWKLTLDGFILIAAHLYTLDVGSTHAATAIYKEQQFSGYFLQLQRFTQQVGTEVEHQDRAAQNVLVVPLPQKLQLQAHMSNVIIHIAFNTIIYRTDIDEYIYREGHVKGN